ncbi:MULTISPECIES: energy-coupling factor transporter transmembrane component T family protein [Micrococcaceae]|uniref:energy-coupling factor transporter transmembrane component T family protein n=1 Tax=unclassified Kocuria TaxID=2649579 RepID=UPI0010133EB0|nr:MULTISPECIES: energy-coupling factor transporter transmembrane component T [unclassified Kocuria]
MTQLHPFTVLTVGLAVVLVSTGIGGLWPAGLVAFLCLALALFHHRGRAWLGGAVGIMVPLAVSQLMVHALFDTTGLTVLWNWGWVRLTAEGIRTAGDYALRLVPIVGVGVLCLVVVDRMRLVAAIDESRVPRTIGYVVIATLNMGPHLAGRSRLIGQAQAVRGLDLGRFPLSWVRRVRHQTVPLVSSAVYEATERSVHLQARGFPGHGPARVPRYREVPDSRGQAVLRRTVLAASIVATAVIVWPF